MPAEYGEPLTERELEMVALVAEGLTNREIAARVFLSPNTVKVHLRNIFAKTGVSSRTELSILAVREGWISVPEAETEAAPVEVEVAAEGGEAGVEEAGEVEDGEDAETVGPLLPEWPQIRWVSLAAGLLLALLILFIPPRGSSAGNGEVPATGLVDNPTTAVEAPTSGEEDGWVELAPLPVRRTRFGVAALAGRIYAVGGLTAEGPTGRLDVYDIENERWSSVEPRPVALANVGIAAVNETLIIPGGCDDQGQPRRETHRYLPAEDIWEEVAPLPEPLCAYALASWEGRVYLFGGWDGDRYRAITYVYDPEEDLWSEAPAPAEARGFGAATPLGDRIFYAGGYDGNEHASCEVYLPEEERWERCAPLLQPRGGLGMAAVGGHLFAVGGGWESYLGFNERYDPEDDVWTVVESPLVGEWRNLGLVGWETSLYAIGGWSGDYLNRTYALEVLPFQIFIPVSPP